MTASREQYDEAFQTERQFRYQGVDAVEALSKYRIDRASMEDAARVLACPVKVNPPSWQHGRVVYSILRELASRWPKQDRPRCVLDIGTAKGFSALCARWALDHAGHQSAVVTSVDVIDPKGRVARNTVAEVEGLRTLSEILEPWAPARDRIRFVCASSVNWLSLHRAPLDFAFVDGKHKYQVVKEELGLLSGCQSAGAMIVLDDVQIPLVRRAVEECKDYAFRYVSADRSGVERTYAVGTHR